MICFRCVEAIPARFHTTSARIGGSEGNIDTSHLCVRDRCRTTYKSTLARMDKRATAETCQLYDALVLPIGVKQEYGIMVARLGKQLGLYLSNISAGQSGRGLVSLETCPSLIRS